MYVLDDITKFQNVFNFGNERDHNVADRFLSLTT